MKKDCMEKRGPRDIGKKLAEHTGVTSMSSDKIPKAIGPYTIGQTVLIPGGKLGFSSGQLGLDPKTGTFPGEGELEPQT